MTCSNISLLSVDELSNVLSFVPPKELIKCCIGVNKSFNRAVFHSNSWSKTRLSSRQLFKCKDDDIFLHFAKNAWNSLYRFSFMNYKTVLNKKQKQILKTRLLCILNSSHSSLTSLQLHGVDVSLFNDHHIKTLNNLQILWIVTTKRNNIITERIWINLISSSSLITLEFMSNFPLKVQDIKALRLAFNNNNNVNLKNLKLSIESNIDVNRETVKLIDLLSGSLENIFITGMKYINNGESGITDSLSKCKQLIVLSLMYRNKYDVNDLYDHVTCYNLLNDLSFSLTNLKVLSLEYGPLVSYQWQDRYKQHIKNYFKSLIWVKIGQNRIKNPFLSTVITQNVKCNRFCLSWNANA